MKNLMNILAPIMTIGLTVIAMIMIAKAFFAAAYVVLSILAVYSVYTLAMQLLRKNK